MWLALDSLYEGPCPGEQGPSVFALVGNFRAHRYPACRVW